MQNKATSAKIHLNHFYIIKYFPYSLSKSDFMMPAVIQKIPFISKISIDSQDEHIFQNFFDVFIYLQILHESPKKQPSFYLIDTNMNMKNEQINHHSEMLKINISFPNELNIISN